MVRIELDESLAEISGGAGLRVLVFNLITWAERTGRVDDLIQGALRHNPGNPALQQLAQRWRPATPALAPPGPGTGSPAPSGPVAIDLFLSYSRQDLAAMQEVQEALREAGLSVWTDAGLEPGTQGWQDAIAEAVNQAQALVVLLSPAAKASQWVKNELTYAQTLGKRIVPILVAGDNVTAVPINLINTQWVDGRRDLGTGCPPGCRASSPSRRQFLPRCRHRRLLPRRGWLGPGLGWGSCLPSWQPACGPLPPSVGISWSGPRPRLHPPPQLRPPRPLGTNRRRRRRLPGQR